ncbi:DgyrCDS7133 [Dimorphilus gyrociliatus]|uniref:DgyrCDS7133 n=1 Tax=Dimorphilus gyrociliatus TaxID=2664684 RepID=A0A7I8VQ63_9ANNE|nr:DgyrCDS7133 [Dimorphilus gyrociliatus]
MYKILIITFLIIFVKEGVYSTETCTYSFIFPKRNLIKKCSDNFIQKYENLTKTIKDLEKEVTDLIKTVPNLNKPQLSFDCNSTCAKNGKFHILYANCQDVSKTKNTKSGIYEIAPIKSAGFLVKTKIKDNKHVKTELKSLYQVEIMDKILVYCDLSDKLASWTVFMRRTKNTNSYFWSKTYTNYVDGFGNLEKDFWLGLEKMSQLTMSNSLYKATLFTTVTDTNGEVKTYVVDNFSIGNSKTQYEIGGVGDGPIKAGYKFVDYTLSYGYCYNGYFWHGEFDRKCDTLIGDEIKISYNSYTSATMKIKYTLKN